MTLSDVARVTALISIAAIGSADELAPSSERLSRAIDEQKSIELRILREHLVSFQRTRNEFAFRPLQIKACQERIKALEKGTARITPLIDPFNLSIGDVGMPGKRIEGVNEESAKKMADMELVIEELADYKILQVLDDGLLLTVESEDFDDQIVFLKGVETTGMVTGKRLAMNNIYEVVETKTYQTAIGATNTVFVLTPFDKSIVEDYYKQFEPAAVKKELPKLREPVAREWKSSKGEHAILATFIGATGDKVSLKKSDGKVVVVRLSDLRQEDIDWIRDRAKNRKK